MTGHEARAPASGMAAGVPYIALPPADDVATAPLVVTWHLASPPRSETAMAAALPLGAEDDEEGFHRPAEELHQALSGRSPERTSLSRIPGMGHPLAEEPGLEPATQTEHAAQVDAAVFDWFRRHLDGSASPRDGLAGRRGEAGG